MIQSVAIVPAYSDGSVKALDGVLMFDCIISPESAAIDIGSNNFTILLKNVETKSVKVDSVSADDGLSITKCNETGTISIWADVFDYLPETGKSLTIAVNVKNFDSGNVVADYTTDFVRVEEKQHEYVEIEANYNGEDLSTIYLIHANWSVIQKE